MQPTLSDFGRALFGDRYREPLARALGISSRTLWYWEEGGKRKPRPGALTECRALAEARIGVLHDLVMRSHLIGADNEIGRETNDRRALE
jgi:transcriptional regulator with XRE-family HTH domain